MAKNCAPASEKSMKLGFNPFATAACSMNTQGAAQASMRRNVATVPSKGSPTTGSQGETTAELGRMTALDSAFGTQKTPNVATTTVAPNKKASRRISAASLRRISGSAKNIKVLSAVW